MSQNNIKPDKITKPIQLLAAWLLGLIILVGSLVTAATLVTEPEWLPVFFSISAVAIIPIFLFLIFQLQTKYRPQMQEDQYYSEYLNQNTMTIESEVNEDLKNTLTKTINDRIKELAKLQDKQLMEINEKISSLIPESVGKNDEFPDSRKLFDLDSTIVRMNQKLERLDEIESYLHDLNVPAIRIFGNKPEHRRPEIFLLSFGPEVNFEFLQTLIKGLLQFGLIALSTASSWKENEIYIGSYAYQNQNNDPLPILKISDNVLDALEKYSDSNSFWDYVERNKNIA